MIRVLITGSREFEDRAQIAQALTQVWREHDNEPLTVVHGGARGADRIAGAIARDFPERLTEEAHELSSIDWRPSGPAGPVDRAAGHKRNQRMVDLGAVVCLAFLSHKSENRGTRGCIAAASRAGIEVREHWD